MTRSIRHVMDNEIPVLDCDDTIADAGRILTTTGRPALPVLNPDFSPFGLLSQCDLLRLHQQGGNSQATHAWEICKTRPHVLPQDSSIDAALQLLAEHGLNELIVVDHAGRFAGVASREKLLEHYISSNADPVPGQAGGRTTDRPKIRNSRRM